MLISKKTLSASAFAALITTAVLVAPSPTTYAAEATTVSSVIVDVNGTKVEVDTATYGMIVIGLGDVKLETYLKAGKNVPKITSLKVGSKYVDVVAYGTNLIFSKTIEEAVAATPSISASGFKVITGFDNSGKPIFSGETSSVFEVIGID